MWARPTRIAFAAAILVIGSSPATQAGDRFPAPPRKECGGIGPNLVRNGGFEAPTVVGADYRIVAAGGTIGPWTVASGAVDFIACGFWQAAEGCQSVDMNSCEAAAIEQTLATKKGRHYGLCFSLAGNPDAAPRRKALEVWWAGSRIATVEFDVAKRDRAGMGWARYSYAVVAPSDSVVLKFKSRTPGCYGPVLDDVVVRELPMQVASASAYSFITRASSSVSAGTTW